MNLGEIKEKVLEVIPNSGITDLEMTGLVNEIMRQAAGIVVLPETKYVDAVDTVLSQAYVSLANLEDGFSGGLLRVKNSVGTEMNKYPLLEHMLDYYGTFSNVGAVTGVCLEGTVLWYQGIPETSETLTVLYYRNPPPLVNETDVPSLWPEYMHQPLFVHGTAWLIWDNVEDGVDGDKLNTNSHFGHFNRGLSMVRAWIARSRPHFISSSWRY